MNQAENDSTDAAPVSWASVGDVIECEVQEPFRRTLRVRLSTAESCAFGNELIALGRWRKSERAADD